MRKAYLILSALMALTMAGCREAPEEVRKENEVLDSAQSVHSVQSTDSSPELLTLDEIRASLESDISQNGSNISVATVRAPESSAMPAFKLKKSFDDYDRLDDIVRDYFGVELSAHPERLSTQVLFHSRFDMTETETLTFDTCKGSLSYVDPSVMSNRISSSGCGYFQASNTGSALVEPYSGELVKAYDLRLGESFPNESYTMTDGSELGLSDAVAQAEEYANKYIAKLYTDKTRVRVYRAEVYKRASGGHGYAMLAEYTDESGNLFLTNDRLISDTEKFLDRHTPIMPTVNLMLCVNESGKPPMITANCVPAVGEVMESGDRLLGFGSAVDILSKRLAPSAMYDLDCATLEYVITAPYSEKYKEYVTDRDGDVMRQFFKELYTHIPETSYEARPFWVFRDFEKNPENLGESVFGGVYLVDALTGEVYVC